MYPVTSTNRMVNLQSIPQLLISFNSKKLVWKSICICVYVNIKKHSKFYYYHQKISSNE